MTNNKIDQEFESRFQAININEHQIESMKHYAEELDYGNIEYKLKLVNTSKERIEGLITQMKFRLQEGNGQCIYQIGVEDNGNPLGLSEDDLKSSLATLSIMTEKIEAVMTVLNYSQGKVGVIAEILVTKPKQEKQVKDKVEIKIGLIGEECSGKSTLVFVNVLSRLDAWLAINVTTDRGLHGLTCSDTSMRSSVERRLRYPIK